MSAFSIKLEQHNKEAQMNMSLSKSILPLTCSESLLISTNFTQSLEKKL